MTAPYQSYTLQLIPIDQVHESPLNPRKHFDPLELKMLQGSLETHGQLTPGLVRPRNGKGGYEIAAGHRRYRAAKAAGLEGFEAKVRDLNDAEFVEILTLENSQRQDLHPLEEADGYRLLMEHAGYDVAKIAARVQRSHDYVYDRLRLLKLTPALKKDFLAGRFQLAHAIILSRLSAEDQARASDVEGAGNGRYTLRGGESGLYRIDYSLFDQDGDEPEHAHPYTTNTPGELQRWVDANIRFKPESVELDELFPETAVALANAEETGTRVVAITYEYRIPAGAHGGAERTYGKDHWKRADGLEDSEICDYAVIGVVKGGTGRGQALGVCVSKDSCKIHWKAEQAAAARRRKDRVASSAGDKGASKREANRDAQEKAAAAKREAFDKRCRVAAPALRTWLADRIRLLPITAIAKHVVEAAEMLPTKANKKQMALFPVSALSAAEEILRAIVFFNLEQHIPQNQYDAWREWDDREWKDSGLDFRKALDEVAPVKEKVQAPAATSRIKSTIVTLAEVEAKTTAQEPASVALACQYCGCTEDTACELAYGPCTWLSKNPPVCTNPKCIDQHSAAVGKKVTPKKKASAVA